MQQPHMKQSWQILIIAILSMGVWWGANSLPLTREDEPIVGLTEPLQDTSLSRQPVIQTVSSSGQRVSGFTFTSRSHIPYPRSVKVIVKDSTGKKVAQGRGNATRFKDNHTEIDVPVTWFTLPVHELYSLEITTQRSDVSLVSTLGSDYTDGHLIQPQTSPPSNIVFGIIHPILLSSSTKQGIYLGLVSTLLVFAAHVLSTYVTSQRLKWLLHGSAVVITCLLISVPLIWSVNTRGIGDWDYRFSLNHIYRQTIITHREFPLWNPYMCGGAAALGDPEFSVISPGFLEILLFGVAPGFKTALVTSLIITATGAFCLAKQCRSNPLGAPLAAILFAFNGAYILKIVEGHPTIIFAYMWLPWVLWAWAKAYNSSRQWYHILATAVFLSLMLYAGGIYVLSYLIPLLVVLPLIVRQHRKAFKVTVISGLLFLGLSAAQLIPTVAWLRAFPDQAYVNSTSTFAFLQDIFFRPHSHGSYILPGQLAGWHEYGAYIGYIAFALACIGASWRKPERRTPTLLALVACTIFLASSGPTIAPLFDKIPFIPRSNISRLALLTTASVALLAAQGITRLQRYKTPSVVIVIVVGAVIIDLFAYAYPQLEKTFPLSPVRDVIAHAPYPIAHTRRTFTTRFQGQDFERSYAYTKAGFGTTTFCTVIGPKEAVNFFEDDPNKPFAYTANIQQPIEVSNWSPNHLRLSYNLPQPEIIKINSNYAQGWHASVGEIKNRDGQLMLHAIPGAQEVDIRYKPPGLKSGLIITLLTILSAIYWSYHQRK
jgi:hypothetical protein